MIFVYAQLVKGSILPNLPLFFAPCKVKLWLVMGRVNFLRVRAEYESGGVECGPSTSLLASWDSHPKVLSQV